jgi:hypothetical protein
MKARKKKITWNNTIIDSLKGEDSSIFAKQESVLIRAFLINKETLQKSFRFNENWTVANVDQSNKILFLKENQNCLSILGMNYIKSSVLGAAFSKN